MIAILIAAWGRKKKGGGGRPQDAQDEATPGRKTRNARDSGGATRGKGNKRKKQKKKEERGKNPTTTANRAARARRGPNKQRAHQDRPQETVRRTKTRQGGQPARPSQEEHTHTHTQDPGVASSDPKAEVSASTRNSPGALGKCPFKRQTVPEIGRASDRVIRGRTTAAYAAQDRSRRDPPGTTPLPGPERVRRRARQAPLLRQGPAVGTMNPVPGRPPRAPRSNPVRPGAIAPWGGGRHHGDGKTSQSTEGDQTGRGAAHQPGATRHAREARDPPKPQHEDRCQATTATRCRTPGKHAQHTTNRGMGEGARDSRAATLAHRTQSQWVAGPGRTPQRTSSRGWESSRTRTPHTQSRGAPPGHPGTASAARKASSQERALWGW